MDWLVTSVFINFVYNLAVTYEGVLVTPIRCVIENVSGFIVNYHGYQEISTVEGNAILKYIGETGPLHLQPVHQPYPTNPYNSNIPGRHYIC
jgi:Acetyl-CoA carboxylase, central region